MPDIEKETCSLTESEKTNMLYQMTKAKDEKNCCSFDECYRTGVEVLTVEIHGEGIFNGFLCSHHIYPAYRLTEVEILRLIKKGKLVGEWVPYKG